VSSHKVIALGVTMLLACCLAVGGCRGGKEQAPPEEVEGAPSETASDVPVLIEAYYPLNPGHQFIADYVSAIGEANPETVQVVVYDMQSPEGREKWMTTGLSCAGVFVNGSTGHQIKRGDKVETVHFLRRMDVSWTREDLLTVIQQELDKVGATLVPPKEAAESAEDTGKD
jgi:hypothetical protein